MIQQTQFGSVCGFLRTVQFIDLLCSSICVCLLVNKRKVVDFFMKAINIDVASSPPLYRYVVPCRVFNVKLFYSQLIAVCSMCYSAVCVVHMYCFLWFACDFLNCLIIATLRIRFQKREGSIQVLEMKAPLFCKLKSPFRYSFPVCGGTSRIIAICMLVLLNMRRGPRTSSLRRVMCAS